MVSERFLALPQEKQRRLENAGFKVFGRSDYHKASTEDIAREAGISKGYLFYYFTNKRALYLYLYDRAVELARQQVLDEGFARQADFFDMMDYAMGRKAELVAAYPDLMPFFLRAYFSQREELAGELGRRTLAAIAESYQDGFRHIDRGRFLPGVEPEWVMRMMQWMVDGYLHEQRLGGQEPDAAQLTETFRGIARTLRQLCYKEEYR